MAPVAAPMVAVITIMKVAHERVLRSRHVKIITVLRRLVAKGIWGMHGARSVLSVGGLKLRCTIVITTSQLLGNSSLLAPLGDCPARGTDDRSRNATREKAHDNAQSQAADADCIDDLGGECGGEAEHAGDVHGPEQGSEEAERANDGCCGDGQDARHRGLFTAILKRALTRGFTG